MGRSAGTGQPLWFRCWRCRRKKPWGARVPGRIGDVALTGRRRSVAWKGNAYGRSSTMEREYRCLFCGYVGWSRHRDLEHLEDQHKRLDRTVKPW